MILINPPLTDLAAVRHLLPITLSSFGLKSGQPFPPADLYIDCRGVADPSQSGLSGSGDSVHIQQWVSEHTNTSPYYDMVVGGLLRLTTRRGRGQEYDKPFHIVCMCAWGIHRSRAMKYILARLLREVGCRRVKVIIP